MHALESLRYVSGTKLDERIIRADLDPGYLENRQYGRGKSGGQVRDEYREVSSPPARQQVCRSEHCPLTLGLLNPLDRTLMPVVADGVISRVIKRWRRVDSANRTRSTEVTTTEEGGEKFLRVCVTITMTVT